MIDTTLSSFERDVIEASMEVPVLLDFWAPWCGPCKTLGPLLERLEREYGGRWKLVKVNSDTNPELVASFNLKSIPYAVAFVDGNAVAQFMGAQPEAYVRALWDGAQSLPMSRSAQAAFLHDAADPLARTLRQGYAAACTRLDDQGVEPAVYRTIVVSPSVRGGSA